MLRAAVVPGWEETTRIPLDKLLKRGKIVRGEVKSVTSGSVTLADGTTLTADYIVLAHGAPVVGNFPAGKLLSLSTVTTPLPVIFFNYHYFSWYHCFCR